MQAALPADVPVLLRLAVAAYRRERGAVWVIYSVLPFAFIPIIEIITHYYMGH